MITATTGNHGQSIALACRSEGVPCTIVTPLGNNPEKNAAMRAYGAELIEYGRDFDEARERVEQLQQERGLRYIHSANEPLLIAGVGTYALEIFEEQPDTDVILVPIGGGSGACGCAHRADRPRQPRQGDRRAGGAGGRLRAIVEGRLARRRREGRHLRGRDGDAGHLRPAVRHPRSRSSTTSCR